MESGKALSEIHNLEAIGMDSSARMYDHRHLGTNEANARARGLADKTRRSGAATLYSARWRGFNLAMKKDRT